MSRNPRPLALITSGVILLFVALALVPASRAEAQCGSQASSCKNCHEVQGQHPVNNNGEWHTQHAFGDFCAFCHAGNVQATDEDAAHAGMVAPLSDVQASCAACHPEDALDLGKVYGAALGVEVGTGGGASPGGSSPSGGAPAGSSSSAQADQPPLIVPPDSGVIDFNQRYAETVAGKREMNIGNLILSVLIAMIALGGGGYVLWRERKARMARAPHLAEDRPSSSAATPMEIEGVSPEIAALLPQLEALNPLGRRALARLLEDPASASDLLYRLSRLDPDLVRQMRGLDTETRALIVALSGS